MEFKAHEETEKYQKFFCSECGKWLGTLKPSSITEGIYPYCPRCKKQTSISRIPFRRYEK